MDLRNLRNEEGQTLIFVSLTLIVLLAFAALAVDVSYGYAQRRNMQNAADAAALAGAYQMCFVDPTQSNVEKVAQDYATENNLAAWADVDLSHPGVAGGLITVTTQITTPTFLAGVLGFPEINVGAQSVAACGAANRACGLWPLAFDIEQYNDLLDGGAGCGTEFQVWNDDKIVDCSIYDCDLNNDGTDDVIVGGDRGWLDFSEVVSPEYEDSCVANGCGASELECHIRNDEGALINLPACIPGDSGVKAGVKDGIISRINDSVSIALFDSVGCNAGRTCPGGLPYHVVSFGCVKVKSWEQSLKLDKKDGSGGNVVGKAIVVEIDCDGCETTCGGTDGSLPIPGGIRAVNLLK